MLNFVLTCNILRIIMADSLRIYFSTYSLRKVHYYSKIPLFILRSLLRKAENHCKQYKMFALTIFPLID